MHRATWAPWPMRTPSGPLGSWRELIDNARDAKASRWVPPHAPRGRMCSGLAHCWAIHKLALPVTPQELGRARTQPVVSQHLVSLACLPMRRLEISMEFGDFPGAGAGCKGGGACSCRRCGACAGAAHAVRF